MPKRPPLTKALIEELERRLLLSADPASALLDLDLDTATGSKEPVPEFELLHADADSSAQVDSSRRELFVVDGGLDDYELLVEDLRASDTGADILTIQNARQQFVLTGGYVYSVTAEGGALFTIDTTGGSVGSGDSLTPSDQISITAR